MTLDKVKSIATHVAATVASAFEAKRRGEIVDFEIVVDSKGNVIVRTVRQ